MATTPPNERSLSLERKPTHQIEPTITEDYHTSTSPSLNPSSHTEIPSTSSFAHGGPSNKTLRLIESARLGLTVLVILLGITVLSTSADVLSVYNKTHVGPEFLLPLWGGSQDVRGEVAILVGGAIVVFAGGVGIFGEKVYALRSFTSLHTILSFLAPIAGLITSIVAVALQYHINNSSSTKSTLQSWSCQWQNVAMSSSPNFYVLCKETRVALYLSVVLIPLEVVVLGLAGARLVVGRKVGGFGGLDRKG